jgi:hypothetical protein
VQGFDHDLPSSVFSFVRAALLGFFLGLCDSICAYILYDIFYIFRGLFHATFSCKWFSSFAFVFVIAFDFVIAFVLEPGQVVVKSLLHES